MFWPISYMYKKIEQEPFFVDYCTKESSDVSVYFKNYLNDLNKV